MSFLLSLLPAVAGVAGSVIKGSAAAKNDAAMIEARNRATEAELARQKVYQGQSGGVFDAALAGFSPETQNARLAGGQDAAKTFFSANAPTMADVGTIGTKAASPGVAAAEASKVADVFGRAADRRSALGNLTGWDTLGFENRKGLAESGRDLDFISGLARNSASIADLERGVAANNAYKPPGILGDLLTFAGTVGSYNAGKGGGAPFSLPTRTPAIPWSWGGFDA